MHRAKLGLTHSMHSTRGGGGRGHVLCGVSNELWFFSEFLFLVRVIYFVIG